MLLSVLLRVLPLHSLICRHVLWFALVFCTSGAPYPSQQHRIWGMTKPKMRQNVHYRTSVQRDHAFMPTWAQLCVTTSKGRTPENPEETLNLHTNSNPSLVSKQRSWGSKAVSSSLHNFYYILYSCRLEIICDYSTLCDPMPS